MTKTRPEMQHFAKHTPRDIIAARSFLTCRRVFLDMWRVALACRHVILTDRRTTREFDMSAHVFGTSVRVFGRSLRVCRMSAAPRLCHVVRSCFGMAAHSYWHVGASLLTCRCGFVGMSAGRLSHSSLSMHICGTCHRLDGRSGRGCYCKFASIRARYPGKSEEASRKLTATKRSQRKLKL